MLRDADGDQFFGFCGMRVYVPDDDPCAEGMAEGVLRRFRERLKLAEPAIRARSTAHPAQGLRCGFSSRIGGPRP